MPQARRPPAGGGDEPRAQDRQGRHLSRDGRAAVLDGRRIGALPAMGLRGHRHDQHAGGEARPRGGDLLCDRRHGDRLRLLAPGPRRGHGGRHRAHPERERSRRAAPGGGAGGGARRRACALRRRLRPGAGERADHGTGGPRPGAGEAPRRRRRPRAGLSDLTGSQRPAAPRRRGNEGGTGALDLDADACGIGGRGRVFRSAPARRARDGWRGRDRRCGRPASPPD